MATDTTGLGTRLGVSPSATGVAEALADAQSTIKLLTGIKTLNDDLDSFVYEVAMDAYRAKGYGSATATQQIVSVKDDKQEVKFGDSGGSGGSYALSDLVSIKHSAILKRIKKLRW